MGKGICLQACHTFYPQMQLPGTLSDWLTALQGDHQQTPSHLLQMPVLTCSTPGDCFGCPLFVSMHCSTADFKQYGSVLCTTCICNNRASASGLSSLAMSAARQAELIACSIVNFHFLAKAQQCCVYSLTFGLCLSCMLCCIDWHAFLLSYWQLTCSCTRCDHMASSHTARRPFLSTDQPLLHAYGTAPGVCQGYV